METMSYPCSPILSFPTHEENSYVLWSPQLVSHDNDIFHADCFSDQQHDCVLNATLHVDHSSDQQHDYVLLDTTVLESNDLHLQDASHVGVFTNCDDILTQEDGDLAAIREELMENSLTDLLLTGAEAVEAGDSSLASVVFSRLDVLLLGIPGNASASSFDRLAYHFDQGLRSRISGACTRIYPQEASPSDRMSVHQIIQELSPFVKFAHFTANQAILDATNGDTDVHIVDLNIGEGIQWPSLMSDLARHGGRSFHLTVITTDADYNDSTHHHTAARRLLEFAESLSLPFQYSFLCIHGEDDLHDFSKSCKGSVIISCDTTIISYNSLTKLQTLLLGCVTMLQPKLIVTVEEELVRIGKGESLSNISFVDFFFEALHHFTTVFHSLASCFNGRSHSVCLGLVEREMVGPRIQDFVARYRSVAAGTKAPGILEGFRVCQFSSCNVAQARMLVGLFSRGFGVLHEKGRLALCWKSRPLTSVSIWAPV